MLYHGKYLCNNQIASLAQFIDTCFYNEKVPHSTLKLVWGSLVKDSLVKNFLAKNFLPNKPGMVVSTYTAFKNIANSFKVK
jgi:hypothetical protein